jgi:geranylgeranyl reductase family protein
MQIAIVGAGPAGLWASILLARLGHAVTLIDSQAPWEKPCGGGITAKALANPEIFGPDLPRKQIERITIFFSDERSVTVEPEQPMAVVSRRELSKHLLEQAQALGVQFLKDRVTQIHSRGARWLIRTRENELHAEFLIGADGATSIVRRAVGKALQPDDLCVTLGYFIPGDAPPHMKIFFVPSLQGYLWSFPRPGHLSYGLITRSGPGWTTRAKSLLSNFLLADLGAVSLEQAEFYSAPVPCLGPRAWKENRIQGDGWALLGDAAGLADPITGEGIHFALKSAEILAATIDQPGQYAKAVWNDMGRELARASHMYQKFYSGRFLAGDFRKRTIQLSDRSRTLRGILGNLIAGNQPYLGLKKKLIFSSPRIGWELLSGRR